MAKLRGGVLGFGKLGQNITRYINNITKSNGCIVAACRRDAEALKKANEEFKLECVTTDARELVKQKLDFVVISSTNNAHLEHVRLASEAGLHILCEKPIALTLDEADRMIDVVEKAGVINVVNYTARHSALTQKIKQLLDAGTLGELLSVVIMFTRGYGFYSSGARHDAVVYPENSGGWSVHHACHAYDYAYYLGGPIEKVYAGFQSTVPDKESEEVIYGMLNYKSGVTGVIGDSVCRLRDRYIMVTGTKGAIAICGDRNNSVTRLHLEGADKSEVLTIEPSPRWIAFDHLIDCIEGRAKSQCTIRDGRHSLAVALAMQESARRGQVVPVPN